MSGAWIRSMKLRGEIDSRKSASFSGSPYSTARSGRRQDAVRSKNVLKLAMPTMSTVADRVHAQTNVVERHVRASVAGRPAHVRLQHVEAGRYERDGQRVPERAR